MTPRSAARKEREFRVIVALRRLHDVTRVSHRLVEQRTGASIATMRALARIGERDGIRASELAADLGLHRSTASNLVKALTARGWVSKRRVASDQRSVRLQLTAGGKRIVRLGGPNARGLLMTLAETLSDRELGIVARGLEPIMRRLGGDARSWKRNLS